MTPAELTRMSADRNASPCRQRFFATVSSTTSHGNAIASAPDLLHQSFRRSARRAETTSPAAAGHGAPSPMPDEAPVTSATRPEGCLSFESPYDHVLSPTLSPWTQSPGRVNIIVPCREPVNVQDAYDSTTAIFAQRNQMDDCRSTSAAIYEIILSPVPPQSPMPQPRTSVAATADMIRCTIHR
jgi:hypothetical protein